MRKILPKEEVEKKQKRNRILVGFVLISVMLLSTLGYAFFNREDVINNQGRIEYKGIEFIKNSNGLWESTIEEQTFTTYYNPQETENISTDFTLTLLELNSRPLYFVSDNREAVTEIIINIGRYVSRYQEVCLQGMNCDSGAIVKNCTGNNIIIFKEKEQIKLYKESGCIFIEAPSEKQVLASDRLIFKLIGIQN